VLTQDTSLVAIYRTEYYLSVTSDVNKVSGSGWYEQGSQATFGVAPSYAVTSWFGYTTYEFSDWSGDSNSTNNISSIIMNSPKNVNAEWTLSKTTLDPIVVAYAVLLACLTLAARALYLRSRRGNATKTGAFRLHLSVIPLLLIALVVIGSLSVPAVRAGFTMQPKVVTVKIGDASWYYWNQTASDTCLLWLGGGLSQAATDTGGYYWINPFGYESFGTIQFIQQLAKYYCVIALEQGSNKWFDSAANRTIFQEVYSIRSTIIDDVHNWIREQGYEHTYIIGYSVGGQAAALEVTLRNPTGWTNEDGLVLITVPFSSNVIIAARDIHLNLLLLYGGNLPDFEATGLDFYKHAPSEGWHGTSYYHKQFVMLQEVGHELWTVRDTGAYSPIAENAVVSFIEKSKALQFTYTTSPALMPHPNLTSVKVRGKVATDQLFLVDANITNPSLSNSTVALLACDRDKNPLSSTIVQLAAKPISTVRLVMPPISNASQQSFDIVLLLMVGTAWVQAAPPQQVRISVANTVNLRISVSVPNITLILDGSTYTVPPTGAVHLQVAQGRHSIQVQPVVELGNHTRGIFTEWEDESVTPRRTFFLDNDTVLSAIYRRQYLVNATSQYGTITGSGWYDEQSVATITVQPPIDNKAEVIFSHWIGDSTSSDLRILLIVDAPKTVIAEWDSIHQPILHESDTSLILAALSLSAFAVLLVLNFRKSH
jgi:pimeloyl-ACP methyl ester carboxylesterase